MEAGTASANHHDACCWLTAESGRGHSLVVYESKEYFQKQRDTTLTCVKYLRCVLLELIPFTSAGVVLNYSGFVF